MLEVKIHGSERALRLQAVALDGRSSQPAALRTAVVHFTQPRARVLGSAVERRALPSARGPKDDDERTIQSQVRSAFDAGIAHVRLQHFGQERQRGFAAVVRRFGPNRANDHFLPPADSAATDRRDEPPFESRSLLEGEQLGQFLLEKFVGGGGMGVVFRALDTTLNREVAVKVLSRDQSADEETLRRFRNEAQSAARLNHDNIARVHYVGEDRGVHYIVFEFIEGVNIRDLVEQQRSALAR